MQILKEKIVRYETDGSIVKGYDAGELIRCKDCKHFELDRFDMWDGVPIITGHEVCTKWAGGSKTSANGYCFMAEKKETE